MKMLGFGKSQSQVSAISLGCMNFGTRINLRDSFELLDKYYELGGNFLDTANNYAFWNNHGRGGDSETVIGDWISKRKGRNNIFIATKIGARPLDEKSGFENIEGLSGKAIVKAVDESLARLKTDHIDLLYAHIDDKAVPLEATLYELDRLVKQGKVKNIGCSNYTDKRLAEAITISNSNHYERYCCVQNRYSYLQPDPQADLGVQRAHSKELIEYCTKNNIHLLAYSPLLHGYYKKQDVIKQEYMSDENKIRITKLNELSKNMNLTQNQLVLCWLMQSNPGMIPVMAVSNQAQLEENMAVGRIHLSNKTIDFLNSLYL